MVHLIRNSVMSFILKQLHKRKHNFLFVITIHGDAAQLPSLSCVLLPCSHLIHKEVNSASQFEGTPAGYKLHTGAKQIMSIRNFKTLKVKFIFLLFIFFTIWLNCFRFEGSHCSICIKTGQVLGLITLSLDRSCTWKHLTHAFKNSFGIALETATLKEHPS